VKNERAIIVAAISCKDDIENQVWCCGGLRLVMALCLHCGLLQCKPHAWLRVGKPCTPLGITNNSHNLAAEGLGVAIIATVLLLERFSGYHACMCAVSCPALDAV
jgi:hypothetical protein